MTTYKTRVIICAIVYLAGGGLCVDEEDEGWTSAGDDLMTDSMMDMIVENSNTPAITDRIFKSQPSRTVEPSDVVFRLYTRNGNSKLNVKLRKPPDFRSDRETKILIHGFLSSGNIYLEAVNGYLLADDYNVIIVDWSGPARCWHKNSVSAVLALCYTDAVDYHISAVGRLLALLLDILFTPAEVDNIHIIGHSLGAHVAGIAGARHLVGRITGLDPAAPFFDSSNQAIVLNKQDAKFVDVIHTSVGSFGWTSPLGHADFYPNDGKTPQPGCKFPSDVFKSCSHARAYEYFIESIKGNYFYEFAATPCGVENGQYSRHLCSGEATNVMGEYTTPRARGIYYVQISPQRPFAVIFGSSNCVAPASSVALSVTLVINLLRYWE